MQTALDSVNVSFEAETGIGYIELNRPDSLNALSVRLREDIITALQLLEEQNEGEIEMKVAIIEGAGGNFCAGADIKEFGNDQPEGKTRRKHYDVIMDFPMPVIAKIEGYCLGGGFETALACDFRIAHHESRLGLPEVNLGIMPGSGGVQFISRLSNYSVAMELAMSGEHISAEKAERLGIVNHVYDDDFETAVEEFAEMIASKPPLATQMIKAAAKTAVETGLQEGRKQDQIRRKWLGTTEDHSEGAKSFADDEYEPVFRGR